MTPLRRLHLRLRRSLAARVQALLLPSGQSLGPTRRAAAALTPRLDALQARLRTQESVQRAALASRRFRLDMSIDDALRLHSGARDVLAQHHLSACHSCPVRHDETLEELAAGHQISADGLLRALNDLLSS